MSDGPLYKLTVSPSTDTDPPTNSFYTVDALPGIVAPVVPQPMMSTPYDFGATGNGVDDDVEAMQAWLDAIAGTAGYLATGTYAVSNSLRLPSCTIYGAGRDNAIITITPDFPPTSPLIRNKNQTTGTRIDTGITLYSCGFQGSSSTEVAVFGIFDLVGIEGLTMIDCKIGHWRRHLVALSNCNNVIFRDCEFYDWGSLTPCPNPGACLYDGGYANWFDATNTNYRLVNNYYHDGQWSAILTAGTNQLIHGNTIQNVHEVGIFGGLNYAKVQNNTITGVRLKDCAAHGMEISGSRSVVGGNVIRDTDRASLYISNCVLFTVIGNVLDAPNQSSALPGPAYGSTGAITIRNAAGDGDKVDRLSITDNVLSDATGHSTYGIAFYDFGGGPMNNVDCHGNNLAGTLWSGKAISFDDPYAGTPVGSNFMVNANMGAAQSDISVSAINFIIPASTSGSFRVGAVGFYSSRIEFMSLLASADSANASVGQQTWETGWDVTTAAITSARSYFTAVGVAWAANGTTGWSEDTSGRSSITVLTPAGHPICVAAVTALDSDGFTVTINSSPKVVTVANGGSSYANGDTFTVDGGTTLATGTVTANSSGVVTAVTVTGGLDYVTTVGGATTNVTGSGSGLTLSFYSSAPTTLDAVVTAICHA